MRWVSARVVSVIYKINRGAVYIYLFLDQQLFISAFYFRRQSKTSHGFIMNNPLSSASFNESHCWVYGPF